MSRDKEPPEGDSGPPVLLRDLVLICLGLIVAVATACWFTTH